MPAFVISPWAHRGAVVHTRYDQYSAIRTIELILGLRPLSLNDSLAAPMYDAFDTSPDVEGTRYTAVRPDQPLEPNLPVRRMPHSRRRSRSTARTRSPRR